MPESDYYPFDLVETDVIGRTVVELCGSGRFVTGDVHGLFQCSTIIEICCDSCSSKGVTTNVIWQPNLCRSFLNHPEGICSMHPVRRELGISTERSKYGQLALAANPSDL